MRATRARIESDEVDRLDSARDSLTQVSAWLNYEAEQRVRTNSFGKMSVTMTWENGRLRLVEVVGGHTLRPGGPGKLPEGVDGEDQRR